METKLTLSLDKKIIEKAKEYAKEKNTSLSSMVENYFTVIISGSKELKENEQEKTPLTDELKGNLGKIIINEKLEITKYLVDKYINA